MDEHLRIVHGCYLAEDTDWAFPLASDNTNIEPRKLLYWRYRGTAAGVSAVSMDTGSAAKTTSVASLPGERYSFIYTVCNS